MEISVARQHPPSPADLSMPRSKGIVIGFWTVTALFCLQMGFTAYAQLRLPQVAEMVLLAQEFDHLPLFRSSHPNSAATRRCNGIKSPVYVNASSKQFSRHYEET